MADNTAVNPLELGTLYSICYEAPKSAILCPGGSPVQLTNHAFRVHDTENYFSMVSGDRSDICGIDHRIVEESVRNPDVVQILGTSKYFSKPDTDSSSGEDSENDDNMLCDKLDVESSSEESLEDESEELEVLYCVCQLPDDGTGDYLLCDGECRGEYHPRCLGIDEEEAKDLKFVDEAWFCPTCKTK
jgi:hypothetical protein